MNTQDDIRIILFDIGGVLLELNNPVTTFGVDFGEAEFHRRWLMSPSVRNFESGGSTAQEFAESVRAELQLPYDAATFLDRFNAWPGRLFTYAIELVRRIDDQYVCAILSNTNALHWQSFGIDEAFAGRFDRQFLSYETGLLKPDDEAFAHVVDEYRCRPEQILYFDDNPLNVAAADRLGIRAVQSREEASLTAALEGLGIIR